MITERNPALDPQPGDEVKHVDGGTMYIIGRTHKTVVIAREKRRMEYQFLNIADFIKRVAK